MRRILFDMETNGLFHDVDRIWVVSYVDLKDRENIKTITDYEEIKKLFSCPDTLFIGHNIIKYDLPVIKKLLQVEVDYKNAFDTLLVSQALFPENRRHGLAELQNKVEVEDEEWLTGDIELMTERCEVDVKDNLTVFDRLNKVLDQLYPIKEKDRFVQYLSFKGHMIGKQENVLGLNLNLDLINKNIEELGGEFNQKKETIEKFLPEVPKYSVKSPPKNKFKKDGSFTANWVKWLDFLKEHGIEEDFEGEVRYVSSYAPPNAGSPIQIKDWLFSLGWVPQFFEYRRNTKGEVNKVPQIKSEFVAGEVCQSVTDLIETNPQVREGIEALNSMSIIKHRLDIFKGFDKNRRGEKIYPGALGFTNTLRKKHRVLVNLPNSRALYAGDVRRSIIPPKGLTMIGSDLAGIEDATKRHFIYPFDKEYVEEQMRDDFDSHMDIGRIAGLVTDEEIALWRELRKLDDAHKLNDVGKKKYNELEEKRDLYKLTNFSALYGVGAETMSRQSKQPEDFCRRLLDTYWKRNWSVNAFADTLEVKKVLDWDNKEHLYVQNPLNKNWYYLKHEKDKFSAVNQSSGQYVLDVYILLVNRKYDVYFQYHDELMILVKDKDVEEARKYLQQCIEELNNILKLNIEVKASYKYGQSYAEV